MMMRRKGIAIKNTKFMIQNPQSFKDGIWTDSCSADPLGRATLIPRAALEFVTTHDYSLNETEQFCLKEIWLTCFELTLFKSWVEHQVS
jgi:hypothetical protein